jgi:ankyrin repeat protein
MSGLGSAPPAPADPAAAANQARWQSALEKRDTVVLAAEAETVGNPDAAADDGATALMIAAQAGEAGLVRVLLKRGADPNARNANGGTPLMHAAMSGDPAIIEDLIAAGAELDAVAKLGWSALLLAAAKGNAGAADVLLRAGAQPNQADTYGWTPLMRAVSGNHAAAVDVFLAAPDMDIDAREETGATALHVAAQYGYAGMAARLLESGADPEAVNDRGLSAADLAVLSEHPEVARLLAGRRQGGLSAKPGS